MAAYHFRSKIHTRASGASAVRAAAYRAAERLVDARLGVTADYTRKADVVKTAILLPPGSPDWMQDRNELWNRVEARERRKDSQLAQELEISLPRELSDAENWRLATDFAREHLVAYGRVCDIALHVHEAADGSLHPHVHILMPLREVTPEGFGEKHPDVSWRTFTSRRDRLAELRELWGDYARDRAASLGVDLGADWDHRSFADRGIDLEGQPKLGATAQRLLNEGKPADRAAVWAKVERENGARLLARPEIVLEALTGRGSTFTVTDIARWVHRHSTDEQFPEIMTRAQALAVKVGRDERGRERFSTPEMIALEARMVREAGQRAGERRHVVHHSAGRLTSSGLSPEQQDAARTLLEGGDLTCLIGHAGAGKSTMLAAVKRELEAKGHNVRGAALSGIAAQNLSEGSGIEARTLHSLQFAWEKDRERLTANDVLIIDEAGMVGSRQLSRFISEAGEVGAKIILVGDPEQLQAIEAGAAFRAIAERTPTANLTEIRRQREEWQRDATRELATGDTAAALERYRRAARIEVTTTDAEARVRLVERWAGDRVARPDASRLMLAHTRADVRALNDEARKRLTTDGALGTGVEIETVNGAREFATGDRLLFLRNERQLGVRNGTLGTVAEVAPGKLTVRADDGRLIEVNPKDYKDIDHGYAVTIHKSQGVTVDSAFLLATAGLDRHLAYVGASRHRNQLTIVHSHETFATPMQLASTLSRARLKDVTTDYREEEPEPLPEPQPELGDTRPIPPAPLKPPALEMPAPRPTAAFLKSIGILAGGLVAWRLATHPATAALAKPDPRPVRPQRRPVEAQSLNPVADPRPARPGAPMRAGETARPPVAPPDPAAPARQEASQAAPRAQQPLQTSGEERPTPQPSQPQGATPASPAPRPAIASAQSTGITARKAVSPAPVAPPGLKKLGEVPPVASPVPEVTSKLASEAEQPLTDVERAFIQQRNAAPTLEQSFRLRRDRGPRLGR